MGDIDTTHPIRDALRRPAVWLLGAWVIGTLLGRWVEAEWWVWPAAAAVTGVCSLGMLHRCRRAAAVALMLIAMALIAGGWWQVRDRRMADSHISGAVTNEPRLVDLEGRVIGDPYVQRAPSDAMGRFGYAEPSTRFVLQVRRWHGSENSCVMSGRVAVKVPGADWRVRNGDRVRVQGWLNPLHGPSNPGERDRRWMLTKQGIAGQVFCKNRGNWQLLATADQHGAWWTDWRQRVSDLAARSLRRGLNEQAEPAHAALLEALLLGRRDRTADDLDRAFRRTGQAHLLSISGLHVGIIALGAWSAVLVIAGRPSGAAAAALAAVALYVMVVPVRVPLIRAGVMTAVCFAALWRGRKYSAVSALALVGVGVLIWRPWDLFEPGFQLSFSIVAGLLLFVGPVSAWIDRRPRHPPVPVRGGWRRVVGDYLSVNLVAFAVALPLVIHHFGLVSPYAPLVALLMLPLVMAALWTGFATIACTLIWPPLGELIGWLLGHIAGLMAGLIKGVALLPGAWFDVPLPGALWTICAMAFVVALLGGVFSRRRLAMGAAALLLAAWLVWPAVGQRIDLPGVPRPAMQLHMLDVGDGSCYVLRSEGETWMFDCGSSFYTAVGRRTVVPALRKLGVMDIDTLVISHADVDHFNGVIDVARELDVVRIVTHRHVLDEAEQKPWSAAGYLIETLRKQNIAIACVERGWTDAFGAVHVRVLWPPDDLQLELHNDQSLILRFEAAGRRLMLCGDVQQEAMSAMLARGIDLKADVCDLPHHGSFCEAAPVWLGRIGPRIVLQSTGQRRLKHDRWAGHLTGIERLATPRTGMATVTFHRDGRIDASALFQTEPGE